MYDAIVCGAGPAGSIAATVMARGGARVLLLDRARFPRPKLCGDTINPGARAVLRRLDLLEAIEPQAIPIDGMIVTGEGNVRISASYRGAPGLSIERRHLDAALVQAAVAAGVRFEEGVRVRGPLVEGSGADVRVRGVVIASPSGSDVRVPAPIVIAADGRRSRLAIPLGLARHPARPRRWAIGAYMDDVGGVTSFGEMHVRRGRYIGIAPVPSGQTNVCLVVPQSVSLADPRGVLLASLAADPTLRDRFSSARMTDPAVVIGPLAVDARTAGIAGLLLAGDAAGFIDPMTGDGLRFAFRGGELAGAVALAALAGRLARPHEALTRARRREFSAKWRFNRSLRRLVDHDLTVGLAARAAHAAPWLLRRTVAFAGDVPAQ